MKKKFLFFGIMILFSCQNKINYNNLYYGTWNHDDSGLPCFDANLEEHPVPYYAFPHILSTGHVCVVANQWGHINMLLSEGGLSVLNPSTQLSQGAMYPLIKINHQNHFFVV